jgi:2,4-dienoyl-CoA reductase-like NADH-dependent reductase (Old Yellow Enzyme family)
MDRRPRHHPDGHCSRSLLPPAPQTPSLQSPLRTGRSFLAGIAYLKTAYGGRADRLSTIAIRGSIAKVQIRNAKEVEDAIEGWSRVVQEVHAAGAKIFPQLWHVGLVRKPRVAGADGVFEQDESGEGRIGPSGMIGGNDLPLVQVRPPATVKEIREIIEAYGVAAKTAQDLGFDGIEVHGAHGYLIDQFLWSKTNLRTDQYGGDHAGRARFAIEVVHEIRRRIGPT